jgi:acylphosphatase
MADAVQAIVYFEGRVQGVGFRYTACQVADRFAVTGYVRNMPDGRVELVAEGATQEVERFIGAVQDAMGHYIRHVSKSIYPPSGNYHSFDVRF